MRHEWQFHSFLRDACRLVVPRQFAGPFCFWTQSRIVLCSFDDEAGMSDLIWQSIACGLVGLIAGVLFGAHLSKRVQDDEIKAGLFERDGIPYRVERIEQ